MNMTARDIYEKLRAHMKEHWMLWSASFLAEWDQETYMPAGGGEARSNMLGILARLTHEMFTDQKASVGQNPLWFCRKWQNR